ncbi:hypothetical protein FSPOR_8073 [Fusarium sporotrichioides]|uniref:Uncharacterized protein n=1 Tax=Fusarium sporotrichioides TaxID=5514 RepID=A0A395RVV6_FUSSP|nr:hypothetical protein FSPOR_8073 [Fusarium sporotrichioides]
MAATVEINDAIFCQEHLAEVCEDCDIDCREENDAFYGFNSMDRDALEVPQASFNNDGIYHCEQHSSETCGQCFGWKKKIMRAQKEAKRAGS